MGVFTYEDENISVVPPAKLYNTLITHSNTLLPKVIPAIKSVEVIEGSGGPGTVKKITSVDEGGNTKYGLHKIDAVDEVNLVYNYSIVGGDVLPHTVEKVSFETKVVEGSDGGSVVKIVIRYHTKGDAPPTEEQLKSGKEKGSHVFKALEGYLVANPDFN